MEFQELVNEVSEFAKKVGEQSYCIPIEWKVAVSILQKNAKRQLPLVGFIGRTKTNHEEYAMVCTEDGQVHHIPLTNCVRVILPK